MAEKEKYKILSIIGLAVILLLLTFLLIFSDEDTDDPGFISESKVIMTPEKFKRDIDSIIYSFGILEEWKEKDNGGKKQSNKTNKANSNNNSQSGEYVMQETFQIPQDLQTIDINLEVSQYLEKNSFTSLTNEDPRSRNISMEVFQIKDSVRNKYARLNFNYSDKISRTASDVCIVLDSLEYLNFSIAESIIKSPENISVFLPMENDKADFQSLITESKKSYILKFRIGDNDDIASDFKPDMKSSLIKQRVRSVAINFPEASGAVIYFSKSMREFAGLIKDEFRKNNITLFSDTLFKSIITEEDKISRLFDQIKGAAGKGIKMQFYSLKFSEKEFLEYEKRVGEIKKLGYKFMDLNAAAKKLKANETVIQSDTVNAN